MKTFKDFLTEMVNVLYHVTHVKTVPKIRKSGLKPMQTSNWVQAASQERYGAGEIYAFENHRDALRWAAKMDWDFYKEMGSGNIVIISFTNKGEWEVDDASPLDQSGHQGRWFKQYIGVPPEDILNIETFGPEHIAELQTRK
jgi:hypothetical protein